LAKPPQFPKGKQIRKEGAIRQGRGCLVLQDPVIIFPMQAPKNTKDGVGAGVVEIIPQPQKLKKALRVLKRVGKKRGKRLDLKKAAEIQNLLTKVAEWGGW